MAAFALPSQGQTETSTVLTNKYMEEALARGLSPEDYQQARNQLAKLLQRPPASSESGQTTLHSSLAGVPRSNGDISIRQNRLGGLLPIAQSGSKNLFQSQSTSSSVGGPSQAITNGSVNQESPVANRTLTADGDISFETLDSQNTARELLGLGRASTGTPEPSAMDVQKSTQQLTSTSASDHQSSKLDALDLDIDPGLDEPSSPIRRSSRTRNSLQMTDQDFLYGADEDQDRASKLETADSSVASQSTVTTLESQTSTTSSPSKRKKPSLDEPIEGPKLKPGPGTKRDRSGKPPFSYAALIGQAINSKPDQRISLADIYNYICGNYSYYKKEDSGWQNSIRHNLSLNECFVKTPRAEGDAPGKGAFWRIAPGKEEQFVGGGFIKKGHLAKAPKAPKPRVAAPSQPSGSGSGSKEASLHEGDEGDEGDEVDGVKRDVTPDAVDEEYEEAKERPGKKQKREVPSLPDLLKSPARSTRNKGKDRSSPHKYVLPSPKTPSARPGLRSNTVIENEPDEDEDEDSAVDEDEDDEFEQTPVLSKARNGRSPRKHTSVDGDSARKVDVSSRKIISPRKGGHSRSLSRQTRYESSSPEFEFSSLPTPSRHARSHSHASLQDLSSGRGLAASIAPFGSAYPFLQPAPVIGSGLVRPIEAPAGNLFSVPNSPIVGNSASFASHFQSPVSSMRSRFEDMPRHIREGSPASDDGRDLQPMPLLAGFDTPNRRSPPQSDLRDTPSSDAVAASRFLQMMQLAGSPAKSNTPRSGLEKPTGPRDEEMLDAHSALQWGGRTETY